MGLTIAFHTIQPEPINRRIYELEIYSELHKEGATHRQILGRTTTTWKNRPTFESVADWGNDAVVMTGPAGDEKAVKIWIGLDDGIPPHVIAARKAPFMVFQSFRKAKTQVGKFTSGQSRRHGPWNRRKVVHHPGVEARGWSVRLTKDRQRPFENRMQAAMSRAAKQSF